MATTQGNNTMRPKPCSQSSPRVRPSRRYELFCNVQKPYEAPSTKACTEYAENTREMKYLLRNFDPREIRLQEARLKLLTLTEQIKKVLRFRNAIPSFSFAEAARKGASPTSVFSEYPAPKCTWSRWEARRLDADFRKHQRKCEYEGYQLALAIARRHHIQPAKRMPAHEHISLVKRKSLKEARKAFFKDQALERAPKEVRTFPIMCEFSDGDVLKLPFGNAGRRLDHLESRGVATPTSVKQVKQTRSKREYDQNFDHTSRPPTIEDSKFDRLGRLLRKLDTTPVGRAFLEAIVRAKMAQAIACQERREFLDRKHRPTPQMDPEGAVVNDVVSTDKTSNTAIESTSLVDSGSDCHTTRGFHDFSVSGEKQEFKTFYERWIQVENVVWKATHNQGQEIMRLGIPYDIIKDNMDSQNVQLFLTHRWFRTSCRFKFVLNSNQFQVGQLVASVIYGNDSEDVSLWDNVFSSIQRNHCRLNAGTNNDAELVVPYHYMDSVMTRGEKKNFAMLSVRVLNALQVPDSVASECSFTVFCSFEEATFSGMISRSLGVSGQMDSIANVLNAGSNFISTVRGDNNRDNPPLPLQPISFIPQSSSSFAATDNVVDPVNMLRANPSGQVPHADLTDEMTIQRFSRTWGYRTTFKWKVSHNSTSQLFDANVVPLDLMELYPQANTRTIPTPVAYISSFFGKWRGDMEFKFQIVCNKFYSGRIIIGCVPFTSLSNMTPSDLRYSAYQIFDVANSSELVFRCPWNWRNAFCPVRLGKSPTVPSRLFVQVINPLIAIDSVVPEVDINVFIRAGENFELALPRPTIFDPVLSDPLVPPANEYLKPYNKESAWYISWERNVVSEKGLYPVVPYIQNVVNGWVGFTNCELGVVYKFTGRTKKGLAWRLFFTAQKWKEEQGKPPVLVSYSASARYAVHDPALITTNAQGVVLFSDQAKAKAYALGMLKGKDLPKVRDAYGEFWIRDSSWSEVIEGGKWVAAHDVDDPPILEYYSRGTDVVMPVPEMDTGVVTTLQRPAPSTNAGVLTFGENIPDLKSLCRRYNHFGSISAKTCIKGLPRDCPFTARMRVNPVRHVHPESSASYDNRYRHGVITTIGSCYRMWRGSLRYRFVVVGNPPEGTTLYIQHRFDTVLPATSSYIELGPEKVKNRYQMMNTQYATFAQALNVNSMFTIEVPYYQEQESLSLLPRTDKSYSDNGSLYLYLHSKIEAPVHIEVFYSFADDCRFSIFQGVPITMDLNDMNDEPDRPKKLMPLPEMDTKGTTTSEGKKEVIPPLEMCKPEQKPPSFDSYEDYVRSAEVLMKWDAQQKDEPRKELRRRYGLVIGEGHLFMVQSMAIMEESNKEGWFKRLTTPLTKYYREKIDGLKKLCSEWKEECVSKVRDEISQVTEGGLSHILNRLTPSSSTIFGILSHLIYVAINPTPATIAWAVICLLEMAFGFGTKVIESISRFIKNLWTRSTQLLQRQKPTPESDDIDIGSYASVLFVGLSTFLQVKADPPRDWGDIGKGLFKFSNIARGGSFVGKFFSDNFKLLQRVYTKFLGLFGSDASTHKILAGIEDTRLKSFLTESYVITSPQNEHEVFSSADWASKVFELSIVGSILMMVTAEMKTLNTKLHNLLTDQVKKLKELEKKLINNKLYSASKYEPMVVWVSGEAGLGKSYFADQISAELAKMSGYTGNNHTYAMSPGNQYFDGANRGQINLRIPEAFTFSFSTTPELYQTFLVLKSPTPFNPPFAKVDDKDIFLNFLNVVVDTNDIKLKNMPGINRVEAFNRRREVVLHAKFRENPVGRDGKPLMSKEDSTKPQKLTTAFCNSYYEPEDFRSLVMYDYYHVPDPLDDTKLVLIPRKEGEDYAETVLKLVRAAAEVYHSRQAAVYSQRCSQMRIASENAVGNTFDEKLKSLTEAINKLSEGDPYTAAFKKWTEAGMVASTPFIPTPQGEEIPAYPQNVRDGIDNADFNDFKYVEEGLIIEPLIRPMGSLILPKGKCLHDCFDFGYQDYDDEKKIFLSSRVANLPNHVAFSCGLDSCYEREGEILLESPICKLRTESGREDFFNDLWYHPRFVVEHTKMEEDYMETKDINVFCGYPKWIQERVIFKLELFHRTQFIVPSFFDRQIDRLQRELRTKGEIVGNVVLPKKPLWKRVCEGTWHYFLVLCDLIWKAIHGLLAVSMLLLTLSCIKLLLDDYNERPVGELHPSGDYKTVKSARSIKTRCLNLVTGENSSLLDLESSNKRGCMNKIVNNTFFLVGKVSVGDDQFIVHKSRCIGLYEKTFLVLEHYVDFFKAKGIEELEVVFNNGKAIYKVLLKDIKFKWTGEGYGIGQLPASCMSFANITKYMPSKSFSGNYPSRVQVVEPVGQFTNIHDVELELVPGDTKIFGSGSFKGWTISDALRYNWGGAGKCGSFVFAPSMACPLIGIHTAGLNGEVGYAERLLKETFVPENVVPIEYVVPEMEVKDNIYNLDGHYGIVGQLHRDLVPVMARKTRIIPSEIAGVFPITTEPAPLKDDDPRLEIKDDILRIGVSKRCNPLREFPEDLLFEASSDILRKSRIFMKPMRANIAPLTYKEAIEGFDIEGYDSMEMKTSEGFPWIKLRPTGATDKSYLFKLGVYPNGRMNVLGIDKELYDVLNIKHDMRKRLVVPPSYFSACLKDARILREKVKTPGKTRVFEISPVDLTIAQRSYFLDYFAAYKQGRWNLEHTIGINADGPEWSKLANELKEFSPYIITADYKSFGPSVSQPILNRCLDIASIWLDEKERGSEIEKSERLVVREIIKHEIAQGIHVVDNLAFIPSSGLPSGNCHTVELNSLVNCMYIRIAYLALAQKYAPQYADMYWYAKFVKLYTNGDDLIAAIKEQIIEWFNNCSLKEFFEQFGLVMTDALKSGVMRPYCSLEEATYLKRGFLPHPSRQGQWLAPLEKASITDASNWIWKSIDDRKASLVNSEMSCRLAYSHGPEYYDKICAAITAEWTKRGVEFNCASWKSLDMHIWEGTPGPTFSF